MALTLGDQPTPHSQVRSSPALAEPAATFGSHVCAFSNDFAGRASERCRRPPSGSGFQRHQRHDCHILQYLMAPCGGPEPVGLDHARIGSLNLPPVSTWSYDLSGLLGLTWVSVPLSLGGDRCAGCLFRRSCPNSPSMKGKMEACAMPGATKLLHFLIPQA